MPNTLPPTILETVAVHPVHTEGNVAKYATGDALPASHDDAPHAHHHRTQEEEQHEINLAQVRHALDAARAGRADSASRSASREASRNRSANGSRDASRNRSAAGSKEGSRSGSRVRAVIDKILHPGHHHDEDVKGKGKEGEAAVVEEPVVESTLDKASHVAMPKGAII